MKHFIEIFGMAIAAASVFSAPTEADDLVGKINSIAPYLGGQNQVYISLTNTTNNALPDGSPGGSCSGQFAFANMNDVFFKSFVYPLILLAKAADSFITLRTNGCFASQYPVIVGVDYTPR